MTKTRIQVMLDADTIKELDKDAKRKRITKSAVIRKIVSDYYEMRDYVANGFLNGIGVKDNLKGLTTAGNTTDLLFDLARKQQAEDE